LFRFLNPEFALEEKEKINQRHLVGHLVYRSWSQSTTNWTSFNSNTLWLCLTNKKKTFKSKWQT